MKTNHLLNQARGMLLLLLLAGSGSALAQGPTLDPTFQTTGVYKPASVSQVVQQPDGKRLVLSGSLRAGNRPAGPVTRLLANSNEPDSVFTSNARGVQGQLRFIALLPSGKVLLAGFGSLTLGSVTRIHLLRLNADGTPDAGFDAGLTNASGYGSNPVLNVVGQPDGKVIAVCQSPFLSGGYLVRLLPDGTLDTAFQTALAGSLPNLTQLGKNVVVQPDGKLLVPGNFNGRGVVRLLPTGALDPTFTAQLPTTTALLASQVAVQPDGKVLVTTFNSSSGSYQTLVRLLDTGAADPTFQPAVTGYFDTAYPWAPQVQVQPDGKILVSGLLAGAAINPGTPLVRLLPSGALDTSFNATAAGPVGLPDTHLLPNGQILVVKIVLRVLGVPISRLVLLNANGSLNPTLEPRLYTNGQVNDVVQLPTGSYLIGGDFTEFNGVTANYLARLSPTGVPDPTFTAAADNEVSTLLVQPDGKLLVGGTFEHLNGSSRVNLARLLPTGALDTGFAPPFFSTTFSSTGGIKRVAVRPDGRVLAAGTTRLSSTVTYEGWLRLLDATTGQPDLTLPHYAATDLVVQPNGKVVVAGFDTISTGNRFRGSCIFRLLSSGALDPAFTPLPTLRTGFGGGPVVSSLAQSATGLLYVMGYNYIDAGPPSPASLYALQPDGQLISSYANNGFARVSSLAVQPNGRLLVGADVGSTTYGLGRLLSTLAPDPSFGGANRPAPGTVNRLLVQPDGAIMVAGSFTTVGGQPAGGLVRLRDANVLSVSSQQLAALTQVWPVPAHGQLNLRLDAASRPQRVELLDALGRVVLTQPTSQPELTLDTTPLLAGAYVLRVQYASGPVTRRVVVE